MAADVPAPQTGRDRAHPSKRQAERPPYKAKTAAKVALRRGPVGNPLVGTSGSYTTIMLVIALQLVSPAVPTALTCTM